MVLTSAGIPTETAADGEEGLRKISAQLPDLILLDLGMPKVDGFEVMEKMKAEPKMANIPVIVISAWTSLKHREAALEAGATAFISKPYDLEYLTNTVRQHLPKS